MNTIRNIAGFEFIKVGEFYEDEDAIEAKVNGIKSSFNLCIKFIDNNIRKVGESAYVVMVGDDIVYVGEYSFNFQDRWLRQEKYSWHHIDYKIPDELKKGNVVTIWLTVDPYVVLSNGVNFNVSKSIEQEILRASGNSLWNKRGKLKKNEEWIEKNCFKLVDIINIEAQD